MTASNPKLRARAFICRRANYNPNAGSFACGYTIDCIMPKPSNSKRPVVHSGVDILGGTPVFRGTRVPFQTFIGYLEAGHPLADFLSDFPSVTRKHALAALDAAKEALLVKTCVA